jgi:hypothetical protein
LVQNPPIVRMNGAANGAVGESLVHVEARGWWQWWRAEDGGVAIRFEENLPMRCAGRDEAF